jgi:hypothetical protein
MEQRTDYLDFLIQLRRLVEQRATAILQLVTDDRHFVNVGLNKGQIVALYHGPRRGRGAIAHIRKLIGGKITMLSVLEYAPQPDLPETQDILQLLEDDDANLSMTETANQSVFAQSTLSALKSRPDDLVVLDLVTQLSSVEKSLRAFIGPIAGIVMKDAIKELGAPTGWSDMIQLVDTLSAEIDDPEQARKFVEKALASL